MAVHAKTLNILRKVVDESGARIRDAWDQANTEWLDSSETWQEGERGQDIREQLDGIERALDEIESLPMEV